MKKIKIAQVITRMDWGGSSDVVRILAEHLDKQAYELSFICGKTDHPTEKTQDFFSSLGDSLIRIDSLRRDVNPFFDLLAFCRLCAVLRKYKFDIVHTHTAKAGALARLAAFICGVKVIVHTAHGHNFYGYFSPLISKLIVMAERFLALFTTRIVTLTEMEKQDLIKFKVCKDDKAVSINTVVEIDPRYMEDRSVTVRHDLGITKEDVVIGMAGRLEPIKGIACFTEAAVSIARKFPHVRFLIVGEGSLRGFIEDRIKQEGLSRNFILTGWQDDPMRFMQAMDLMALASLNEAVGIVLIEAAMMGVPVIAAKVGGIPEIVKDGKSGILVDPENPQELAQAMEKMINDQDLRKQMGLYARSGVKDKYQPVNFIKNIQSVYGQLINK